MSDGIFPSLISKDRDQNAIANPIWVKPTDGTNSIVIDGSGNLNVILAPNDGVDIGDVDVTSVIPGVGATNLGKAEDAVHVTGDTGVAIWAVRQDTQVDFGQDGDYVPFSINADGELRVTSNGNAPNIKVDDSPFVVGTDSVNVAGFLANETAPDSVNEGDVGVARMTLDRKLLNVLVDATTDANRLAINATGEAQVDVASHGLTNTNALPVSKDNSANSEINPIWVQHTNSEVSGVEVHDYNTDVAVAGDGLSNHDYTVTGTTFLLKSVIVSASGNGKFEIQVGPIASLATVAVGFLTGREGDTKQVIFDPAIEVPVTGTGTVRVIRTNSENQTQDLYSTIIGKDV